MPVFKTGAINHSANSPRRGSFQYYIISAGLSRQVFGGVRDYRECVSCAMQTLLRVLFLPSNHLFCVSRIPNSAQAALFRTGRARLTVVPIYATRDAALAAEVCCEADAKNISSGHLFRDLPDLAKSKIVCSRRLRKIVPENPVRLQPPGIVSTACFRPHAGARALIYSRPLTTSRWNG
jgi:hypothetical protein